MGVIVPEVGQRVLIALRNGRMQCLVLPRAIAWVLYTEQRLVNLCGARRIWVGSQRVKKRVVVSKKRRSPVSIDFSIYKG